MSPTLFEQDYVLCCQWPKMRLASGDLVVVAHPRLHIIVKRIDHISPKGDLWLVGDNTMSTESHSMGWVKPAWLRGKVVWHTPH